MEFGTLYQDLQNSTEMIGALFLGSSQEDSNPAPNRGRSWKLSAICMTQNAKMSLSTWTSSFTASRRNITPSTHGARTTARKYNEQDFAKLQVTGK
jgi:hypothetical protein